MLTVIAFVFLAIGVALIATASIIYIRYNYGENCEIGSIFMWILGAFSCFAFIGCGIGSLCLLGDIRTETKYDNQIAIVEEANQELEQQICSAVEMYLKHEEQIFENTNLNIQVAIGAFSMYPNLKSNELVQNLITTYQDNAAELKALKFKKTELAHAKWLVYFGN